MIDLCTFERAKPIVFFPIQANYTGMVLDKLDSRDETLALQPVTGKLIGGDIDIPLPITVHNRSSDPYFPNTSANGV